MAARSPVGLGPASRKGWTPGPEAFQRFLAWLDQGKDSEGERYVEMRRRLVAYFSRKQCATADELADETLTRVVRRLSEEGRITDAPPAQYCYIVARYVFLESLRSRERRAVEVAALDLAAPDTGPSDTAESEADLTALDHCLEQLSAGDRDLILGYYSADARQRIASRKALAARFRLSSNALTIRACRLRAQLETCVASQRGNG